jgi:hypothetical protein
MILFLNEKQDLLDFNERLLRDNESLQEYETQLSLRLFKAEREAELKLSDSTPIYEGEEVGLQ